MQRGTVVLLAVCAACSGTIGDVGGSDDDDRERPGACSGSRCPEEPGELVLPTFAELASYDRLTKPEYRYVVADLLEGTDASAALAAVDAFAENNYAGYYQNHTYLQAEPRLAALQLSLASALATAFPRSDTYRALCTANNCGPALVDRLLPRIWKRAISPEERVTLLEEHAELPETLFLTRVFASPFFHFKIFAQTPETPREVARKHANLLSFSIAGTFVDEAMQADLDAGQLDDPAGFEPHVRRLLATHSRRFARLFLPQWLGLSSLAEQADDYDGVALRKVMAEPAELFAALLVDGEDVGPLLAADFQVVESDLANLYELEAPSEGWARREGRATLFGTAALSALFVDHETGFPNPIRRGSYVVNRLLCRDIRFPSSAVQSEIDAILESVPEGLSPPERMAYLRSHDTCASCHEQFDHFGLALEEIGALGETLTTYYTGDPIEASGSVGELHYASSVDFAQQLGHSRELQTCFAAQVHTYFAGGSHVESNRRLRAHADLVYGAAIEDVVVDAALRALPLEAAGEAR
ncbi:MAG: DUF1592 domain-containing protein [Sandaracinus sp.]|nr:DUF1592 domain-containing protein [Sandaracinus sp.]